MSKLEFGCVEHLRWIRKHMVPQDDEHKVKTCPFCRKEPATRAGFAICINDDCEQSNYWSGLDIDEWNNRPIEDALNARIAELEAENDILKDHLREAKNILIDKNLQIDSLYEEGYKLQQRIAELEAENAALKAEPKPLAYWSDEKKQTYADNEGRSAKRSEE